MEAASSPPPTTHRSSRAGDPQLHTHVLIANATLGSDGRWSRLYHPAIYEHAKTASYIYEAHLRWELTMRLGVEWGPVINGIADVKGFTPEQLRHFSTPARRSSRPPARAPRRARCRSRPLRHSQGQGARPDRGVAARAVARDAGANPKAIQQFMGHSKIQTTFDVYGHLLPGSHDEIRERMDGYLRDDD